MNQNAAWRIAEQGSAGMRVDVMGSITEETDFRPLLRNAHDHLVMNLSEVQRINSCGVREWLDFVRQLEAKGATLVLERCSPLIVSQLNMIANFTGRRGQVRSILAPYACESCGHEHLEQVELSAEDIELAESLPCPECGTAMEFEELPEMYLQFRESVTV